MGSDSKKLGQLSITRANMICILYGNFNIPSTFCSRLRIICNILVPYFSIVLCYYVFKNTNVDVCHGRIIVHAVIRQMAVNTGPAFYKSVMHACTPNR